MCGEFAILLVLPGLVIDQVDSSLLVRFLSNSYSKLRCPDLLQGTVHGQDDVGKCFYPRNQVSL